ncbi:hypothetical protein P9D34_11340 [Bacillus swezeyi]|uniref:Uncharacterized protein n=1 Tax=Bacillus swezeyi TaxID=1925020 RepID=A0A1R1QIQ4_9BACI|nr:hypothetical protein [Bacillus swezeyi]MEC1261036.1 hypothetical protein [Bacillus swezeyi]MED2928973.1 hypothetical protein [Bacillus swezeyi]MED2944288.1 hypothetical protein [Bacillus swezeyi]MED2964495.1 hypothetical protein [Bacillus swezeyi]MED2979431.1 hypothetical protein [Bacillus swezeyi]
MASILKARNKSGLGFYERMGGKKYLRRKSRFEGMVDGKMSPYDGWKIEIKVMNGFTFVLNVLK